MGDSTSLRRATNPACSSLRRVRDVILIGAICASALAADDPYLKLLDKEATKVDGVSTDTSESSAAAPADENPARVAKPVPSREHFESLLRRQHVGTYSFYRRLPERSREEIFLDYSGGASVEALREKIIDRYLHP